MSEDGEKPPDREISAGREANGRFATGNPGGGRPRTPAAFREKGPRFLELMEAIAEDKAHEKHFDAVKWCCERVYGKAAQDVEVEVNPEAGGILAELWRDAKARAQKVQS